MRSQKVKKQSIVIVTFKKLLTSLRKRSRNAIATLNTHFRDQNSKEESNCNVSDQ